MPASRAALRRGFTLIELLVVLAILAVLLTLVAPRLFGQVEASKEAVLIQNLRSVRAVIDQFHGDTGHYPKGLEELVERQYLRSLPMDPFTESSTTWSLIAPADGSDGVRDLKSGATGFARDGRALEDL